MTSPWYKQPNVPPPFTLARKLDVKSPINAAALFPWDTDALKTLWDGRLDAPKHQLAWRAMATHWNGMLALAGADAVYVVSALGDTSRVPRRIKLPSENVSISCICWAINTNALSEPLVVFTSGALIYVFNLKLDKLVGCLLGHGKTITSITTHPQHPYLFCTTSQDGTTRIYDLMRTPIQRPNNPPWDAHSSAPSEAGAAHGLHTTEPEGEGIGRCVAVLVGGRSGGHQAAVLGASFHPTHPLIATCGLDRCVKIWRLPPLDSNMLSREDKPLFSSSRVHRARVLSITWLSQDLLLSHSAPARMCRDINEPLGTAIATNNMYEEPGTLQIWRWLGFNRFFPPNQPLHQKILRGCASDYQESGSFKIITSLSLPYPPSALQWKCYTTDIHDPMVLLPLGDKLRLIDLVLLKPRPRPTFWCDDDGNSMSALPGQGGESEAKPGSPQQWQPELGWELAIGKGKGHVRSEDIQVLEMGLDGRVVIAIGRTGTLWIWELSS